MCKWIQRMRMAPVRLFFFWFGDVYGLRRSSCKHEIEYMLWLDKTYNFCTGLDFFFNIKLFESDTKYFVKTCTRLITVFLARKKSAFYNVYFRCFANPKCHFHFRNFVWIIKCIKKLTMFQLIITKVCSGNE